MNLDGLRNVGISAHIDSGKTTLSERILYYAGRIHKIHEVRGGGSGATMDHMELEKERGITITSAATSVNWNQARINLIDTPGHVDFTVEVERSLRVLDGAVLVLCAVGGVQAQSHTVDRQMKRYGVPRLAFINKMDRTGADPLRVCQEVRDELATDAILMQLPIGVADQFTGVIDLVSMRTIRFHGEQGERLEYGSIPPELESDAARARARMLESLAMYSDELMEQLLSETDASQDLIHQVTRDATQQQGMTPVFLGSAYQNKGVQPLLDAMVRYLPAPTQRVISAESLIDPDTTIRLEADPLAPFVGMAFKIVDDPFGQLTFLRIYRGTVTKGSTYVNQRTGRKERFSRILRMHADKREEIDEAQAGDIVAVMGIDCSSGDTYAPQPRCCTLESMFVPEPVISIAISPRKRVDADRLVKALTRFRREDPTFLVHSDEETGEMLISGMGELHLEVYLERIRREYRVELDASAPQVSYREAPTKPAKFNYKHRKQTGGSGQYAHIVGRLIVLPTDAEDAFTFEESVVGGRVPKQYIPAVEKGFRRCLSKGPVAEYPVVRLGAVLEDGSFHDVDSSDRAFQLCAEGCFRETFRKTKPVLLEPIMKVDVECPQVHQGPIAGDITSRRGVIMTTGLRENISHVTAEIPLAELFGYATDLRSLTQGQGTFTMELHTHRRVPSSIHDDVVKQRLKQLSTVHA